MEEMAESVLRKLGITSRYKGHEYIQCAYDLIEDNEEMLTGITVLLYPEIAKMLDVPVHNVEYNIRTAIMKSWKMNRPLLEEVCGYKLYKPPSNAEFLDALLYYVRHMAAEEKR